ncbi:hypothetical protein ABZ208_03030 [Streptomyces sp. NPDC006208]|uniref:hypothetical protein n=1 Tax=Streptomyces sp. NPDC006208 TaxID=3156734 RepID=UPI0033B63926
MLMHLRGWLTTVVSLAVVTIAGTAPAAAPSERTARAQLPVTVSGGAWKSGHLQGMALDRRKGFVYYSFTNMLVKTDLRGKPVGSVRGITGHLGDLDFNSEDGRVYGSLEYSDNTSFYIAIFKGDRITRMNMDAQTSGVLTTVHLNEVEKDFTADMNGDGVFDGPVAKTPDHRYGNSGIDGVSFGPVFGNRFGTQRLTVAYGVYANTARKDNDHQVLLQYDVRNWKQYERPLKESRPHRSGPASHGGKFFVYTGNTTYGVQNLEYDAYSGRWLMAVYKGTKPQFPNYALFAVDGAKRATWGPIRGQQRPEAGRLLALMPKGLHHTPTGVRGWQSPGQYGLVSLDDGRYYIGQSAKVTDSGVVKESGRAVLHRWTGRTPNPFVKESAAAAAR